MCTLTIRDLQHRLSKCDFDIFRTIAHRGLFWDHLLWLPLNNRRWDIWEESYCWGYLFWRTSSCNWYGRSDHRHQVLRTVSHTIHNSKFSIALLLPLLFPHLLYPFLPASFWQTPDLLLTLSSCLTYPLSTFLLHLAIRSILNYFYVRGVVELQGACSFDWILVDHYLVVCWGFSLLVVERLDPLDEISYFTIFVFS